MDNTLTIAELKRRGMAAVEDGLRRGPIHILKRNEPAAVVLSETEYRRLLAAGSAPVPGMSALQWVRAHAPKGRLSKTNIDRRLSEERNW